jgi:hypothetical protein
MSSSGGVGGFSSSSSDVDIKQGMAIVGMVLAFLVFLVILRFGCNICIDLAVLRDSDSLLRTLSEIRRCLFPWWHPRTQPQDLSSLSPTRNQGSNSHNTIDGREFELVNMDQLLMGLTPPQKQELVASMLTSKVSKVTKMIYALGKHTLTLPFQHLIEFLHNIYRSLPKKISTLGKIEVKLRSQMGPRKKG